MLVARNTHPSDSLNWTDAWAAFEVATGDHSESCFICGEAARIASAVAEDDEMVEVFTCGPEHAKQDAMVAANVCSIWIGTDWEAWENLLDFPELSR